MPTPRYTHRAADDRIVTKRVSCCLLYRAPGQHKCRGCPGKPPAERNWSADRAGVGPTVSRCPRQQYGPGQTPVVACCVLSSSTVTSAAENSAIAVSVHAESPRSISVPCSTSVAPEFRGRAAARIPAAGEAVVPGGLTMNRSLLNALTMLTHITISTRHNGNPATIDAACNAPSASAPFTAPAASSTAAITPSNTAQNNRCCQRGFGSPPLVRMSTTSDPESELVAK